jgi:hypothetical protein
MLLLFFRIYKTNKQISFKKLFLVVEYIKKPIFFFLKFLFFKITFQHQHVPHNLFLPVSLQRLSCQLSPF